MTTQSSSNIPTGAASTILQGQGVGTASAFSTATYPATTTINELLYSSANNTVGGLTTANRAVLTTTSTGVPVATALATDGQLIIGSTAGAPAAATITAGSGITVTNASNSITIASTGALISVINSLVNGRITLVTGTPVTISDTSASTIYFTPYKGNYISLYTSGAWKVYTFTEINISVPATTSTLYDVYIYDNSGTLTLQLVAWTNSTTRATALAVQDGVYCKTGDLGKRYLGTIATGSISGVTNDSSVASGGRCVFNYYNRVERLLSVQGGFTSYTYSTATWRQTNASTNYQFIIVTGVSEDISSVQAISFSNQLTTGTYVSSGIGINVTNSNSAQTFGSFNPTTSQPSFPVLASYRGILPVGLNTIAWLEIGSGTVTTTWLGSGSSANLQPGMGASTWC